MNSTNRWRVIGAHLIFAVVVVAALQHHLVAVVGKRSWDRIATVFPGLAFGYVMFDVVPDDLPYYRLDQGLSPTEIDPNGAWGYGNARFQLNALMHRDYLQSVCARSARDFTIETVVRNLKTRTESVTSTRQCVGRRLAASK